MGDLVVLPYACLPAVSDVFADFQAVVELRSRQRLSKDDANMDTNNCGHGKKTNTDATM